MKVMFLFAIILKQITYASSCYDKKYDSTESISTACETESSRSSLHNEKNDFSRYSFIENNEEKEIIGKIRDLIKEKKIKELYFFIKNQDYQKHNHLDFLEACLQEISDCQIEIHEKKDTEKYLFDENFEFNGDGEEEIDDDTKYKNLDSSRIHFPSLHTTQTYNFYEEKFFILQNIKKKTPEACLLLLNHYTPLNCNKIIDTLDYLEDMDQLTSEISEKFVINIIKHHSLYDVEELRWILKKHIHDENQENIKATIDGHEEAEYLNEILLINFFIRKNI